MTTEPVPAPNYGPYTSDAQAAAEVQRYLDNGATQNTVASQILFDSMSLARIASTLTQHERDALGEICSQVRPIAAQQMAAWIVRAYLAGLTASVMDEPCACGRCDGDPRHMIEQVAQLLGVNVEAVAPTESAPAAGGAVTQPAEMALDDYTRNVVAGCRWLLATNADEPLLQWEGAVRVGVALVLRREHYLSDIGISAQEAVLKVAAELGLTPGEHDSAQKLDAWMTTVTNLLVGDRVRPGLAPPVPGRPPEGNTLWLPW